MIEGSRSVGSRSEKPGQNYRYDRVPIFSPIRRSNNFEQIFRNSCSKYVGTRSEEINRKQKRR